MKQFKRRQADVLVRLAVILSIVCVTLLVSAGAASAASPAAAPKPLAKNIILMIADGSGFNHNIAADLYQRGAVGLQPWEQFPFQYAVSTYSAEGWGYDPAQAWGNFDYVKEKYTDSAAAATTMACGEKTYNAAIGYIGTSAATALPCETLLETAKAKGKSAGVVTSVSFPHATPAGFVAHNKDRNKYQEIADNMVGSKADVIMGGGNPWYDDSGNKLTTANYQYVSEATWDKLVANQAGDEDVDGDGQIDKWKLIQDKSEFQSLASGPTPKRVFGVPRVFFTLQEERAPRNAPYQYGKPPYADPFIPNMPTLVDMTKAALNVVDNNPKGFFLMIEGGAVDYSAHYWRPGRLIEERIDFNNSILAVMDWVKKNSNWGETLLVITADHETGYLWGPGSGGGTTNPTWVPLASKGIGQQPDMRFYSKVENPDTPKADNAHTNSLVPLWAKGDAARNFVGYADQVDPVRGPYIDNTELYKVLRRAMDPVKASNK